MFSPSLPHPLWSCSLPSVSHSSLTSPSQSFSPCFLKLFSPLQIFADPSLRAVSIYDVTEPLANSHLCKQKLSLGKSCFHFFDYSHNIISRCNPCPKQFTVLPTLQHLTREKEARREALNPSTFPCPVGCSSDASSSRLDGKRDLPGAPMGEGLHPAHRAVTGPCPACCPRDAWHPGIRGGHGASSGWWAAGRERWAEGR